MSMVWVCQHARCFRARRVRGAARQKAAAAAGVFLCVLAMGVPAASAQMETRFFLDPQPIEIRPGATRATKMALPEGAARMSGEKQLDLNVEYTESRIYNPSTGRKDQVRLRSYTGAGVDLARPFVAPTIQVFPGDTVRITLNNRLPADQSCLDANSQVNVPHCFNGTNLHTHGLWVSPAGNSDNVLLSINPGVSFQYEYNIPPDHPAGTYWYHSHRHGSTALQVSSGMAGALIVRGDRPPTPTASGDIDTLLKYRDGGPMLERVLVLQQIQYACLDADGNIKVHRNEQGQVDAWVCDPGDVGGIEFYDDPSGYGQFGFPSWGESGRYTSINGLVLPTFRGKAGRIERWRMIHAGVRDTISLEFRQLKADAASFDRLKAADAARFIEENCTGDPLPYHLIAADGLTMANAVRTTRTTLQPGYRNDALVVFPDAGKYCVINAAVPAAANVSRRAPSRRLLGVVMAEPGISITDIDDYVTRELIAAARRSMPKAVKEQVVDGLRDGLSLASFTPRGDLEDKDVTGRQELTFLIDPSVTPAMLGIGGATWEPRPYDPKRIDRVLQLGGVDEWTLQSHFISHPFHIHVNPFQIVRILDPSGRDVSAPGAIDDAGGASDPQYPGLKGVWKDTIWVKSLIPQVEPPGGIYTVVLRTRYERYIGEYVLHCHILDHEDQGMMENVRVDLPDGAGGTTHGHH